jgi:hypothetical protein
MCVEKYDPENYENVDSYVISDACLFPWDVDVLFAYQNKSYTYKEALNTYFTKKGYDMSRVWSQVEDCIRSIVVSKEESFIYWVSEKIKKCATSLDHNKHFRPKTTSSSTHSSSSFVSILCSMNISISTSSKWTKVQTWIHHRSCSEIVKCLRTCCSIRLRCSELVTTLRRKLSSLGENETKVQWFYQTRNF